MHELRFQSRCFSLLLISRVESSSYNIDFLFNDLEYALSVRKVVLILNLVKSPIV